MGTFKNLVCLFPIIYFGIFKAIIIGIYLFNEIL